MEPAWQPLSTVNTPNGVNQGIVSQTLIHQLSSGRAVRRARQRRVIGLHLSTLYNTTPTQ